MKEELTVEDFDWPSIETITVSGKNPLRNYYKTTISCDSLEDPLVKGIVALDVSESESVNKAYSHWLHLVYSQHPL
jgi:hypothetical protein